MAAKTNGYLVIADITGYTKFLTGSELDHSRGILEDLFETLTARLTSPLILSNIQGDAILAHAPQMRVPDGSLVLDAVEGLYLGFREKLKHMEINTTCPCSACAGISGLDLKFIVHFGEYVEHDLGGRRELSGPDVVRAHRLLKNTVFEETGIRAYALFTESAIADIGMASLFDDAPAFHMEDTDLGVTIARILDMDLRWQRHRGQAPVVVSPQAKLFVPDITRTIKAPPDVVWYYSQDPDQRPRWFEGITKLERDIEKNGRWATGTREHCSHGDGNVSVNIYVDVVPHNHVTYDILLPMDTRLRTSVLLKPQGDETELTIRMAAPSAPGPLRTAWWRLMGKLIFEKKVAGVWRRSLENLDTLVSAEVSPTAAAENNPHRTDTD